MKRGSAALLGGITLLGALLRIWSPGRIGLWGDEMQFLNVAALPDAGSIVRFLALHESHPPLFYLIGHVLTGSAAGVGVMSLLVLCCSIAAIPVAAWLAAQSGVRWAAEAAALLVAVSVPVSLVSVQLRPYALVSVLVLLSTGSLIRGSRESGVLWRASWAAATVLLLYLHHISILFVAAQGMTVLALAWRRDNWAVLRTWTPWAVVVMVVAIPDLLLVQHQERRTGYLPINPASFMAPVRQAVWLGLSFPGEVLLPIALCLGAVLWLWLPSRRGSAAPADEVIQVACGIFLVTWAMMAIASYRHSVLVDHVVLTFAPLGLACVAIVEACLLQSSRRGWAMAVVQAAVVCTVLSALGSIGAIKSNTEMLAKLINAERLPSDFLLLAPRAPGATFNRYLARPMSQVDFPDVGAVRLYSFDSSMARLSDPEAWVVTTDSIRSVREAGRRLWFVYPASWSLRLSPGATGTPDSSSGLSIAKAVTARLHEELMTQFGSPSRVINATPSPWSMELMSAQLFGPAEPAP